MHFSIGKTRRQRKAAHSLGDRQKRAKLKRMRLGLVSGIFLLTVIGGLLVQGSQMDLKRITPQEAYDLMEDEGYVYIDVRTEPEFEGGHPEGAYNIPFMVRGPAGLTPNPDFLKTVEANFPKDAKIILGCQSGNRSLKALVQLTEAGYTQVVEQLAGFGGAKDRFGSTTEPGWQAAGLPVDIRPLEGRDHYALCAKAKK